MINTHSIGLETLVRTALLNKELAPGVAKQVNRFRTELASKGEKRLLAILDDAIANRLVKVIKIAGNQPEIGASGNYSSGSRTTMVTLTNGERMSFKLSRD